jgi:hypothetical protein
MKSEKILVAAIIVSFLVVMPVSAQWGTPTQLTFNTARDVWPSISGDGNKIAFSSNVGGVYEIYVINSDGSGLTQVTDNFVVEGSPSISGDGGKIAFLSEIDNADFEIFVINSDGSDLTQLTDNTVDDWHPSISGDGNKIAFTSGGDIYVVSYTTANQPPVADDQSVSTDEDTSVAITLTASDVDGDSLTYSIVSGPLHGELTDIASDDTVTYTPDADYSGADSFTFMANDGQVDSSIATVSSTVTPVNDAPMDVSITATTEPIQVGTGTVDASAVFTDPDISDTHIAVWYWGDDSTDEVTVTDGSRSVAGSHTYDTPGVYTITLTVTDNDNAIGEGSFHYVVVYDPEGGFVTGGGWINSPAGAYAPDPDLTGKANFGFVSKYKKGATEPTGETEFQFKVADLNFHSDTYDWLVIAGAQAKYKGTGTINGEGDYGFMLSAIDEDLTPSTDVDLFRIKIWDKNNDEVVYDNQMGEGDDADPTTAIAGGSIQIHKSK